MDFAPITVRAASIACSFSVPEHFLSSSIFLPWSGKYLWSLLKLFPFFFSSFPQFSFLRPFQNETSASVCDIVRCGSVGRARQQWWNERCASYPLVRGTSAGHRRRKWNQRQRGIGAAEEVLAEEVDPGKSRTTRPRVSSETRGGQWFGLMWFVCIRPRSALGVAGGIGVAALAKNAGGQSGFGNSGFGNSGYGNSGYGGGYGGGYGTTTYGTTGYGNSGYGNSGYSTYPSTTSSYYSSPSYSTYGNGWSTNGVSGVGAGWGNGYANGNGIASSGVASTSLGAVYGAPPVPIQSGWSSGPAYNSGWNSGWNGASGGYASSANAVPSYRAPGYQKSFYVVCD